VAGCHPWFSHFISITSDPISKDEHYRSLFLPGSVSNVTAINNEKTNISPPPPPDSLESQFATLLPYLPNPRPLSEVIVELRQNLSDFSASMLGEVGLDGGFRIYLDYFASPRHRTTFTIPLAHQVAILEAQIEVAVELGKNISMHSVRCEQATLELFDNMKRKFGAKWNRISVDIIAVGSNLRPGGIWRYVGGPD
jgi:Tat protein secretion system quality control protein TatD with DNase activity